MADTEMAPVELAPAAAETGSGKVPTASDAGVGGLASMFAAKDEAAKEPLPLKELKKLRTMERRESSDQGEAATLVTKTSGKAAAGSAEITPADAAPGEAMARAPSRSLSRRKSSMSRRSLKRTDQSAMDPEFPPEPEMTEEERAKLYAERETAWAKEKEEYEKLLAEKELVLNKWKKTVRVAESTQRVKDRRKIVKPKKVRVIPDYIEADLYGRGFDYIFGEYAQEYTVLEAAQKLEMIRNKKAHVQPGEYVDYDVYGRGDPRIFGEGAHIESKRQCAEVSLAKQEEASKKPAKSKIKFPVGADNYYRDYEKEKASMLRSVSQKVTPLKANVYDAADTAADELVMATMEDILLNTEFDLEKLAEMDAEAAEKEAEMVKATGVPADGTAVTPTTIMEGDAAAAAVAEPAPAVAADLVPVAPEKRADFQQLKSRDYALADESNAVVDETAKTDFKSKFSMFEADKPVKKEDPQPENVASSSAEAVPGPLGESAADAAVESEPVEAEEQAIEKTFVPAPAVLDETEASPEAAQAAPETASAAEPAAVPEPAAEEDGVAEEAVEDAQQEDKEEEPAAVVAAAAVAGPPGRPPKPQTTAYENVPAPPEQVDYTGTGGVLSSGAESEDVEAVASGTGEPVKKKKKKKKVTSDSEGMSDVMSADGTGADGEVKKKKKKKKKPVAEAVPA
ncbi:hypothetical protein FVE85_8312 [Porphyridium purpureum]|uniref:Uncharacterized protein n=1 Tax=Porphyridium purpureum TaxID=35688 RepID=A0A5J4YLP8_PORPP|nr:hypothetical protein FVE85_8312 [Porphyridium purpureum]|eukprot:POR3633..scf244_11